MSRCAGHTSWSSGCCQRKGCPLGLGVGGGPGNADHRLWLAEKMAGRLSFAVTASGLRVGRVSSSPFLPRRTHLCDTSVAARTSCVPSVGGWLIGATAPQRATRARLRADPLLRGRTRRGVTVGWPRPLLTRRALAGTVGARPLSGSGTSSSRRGDLQIGVQEALAVLLVSATFWGTLAVSVVTVYVDKSGVINNYVDEGSKAPETNAMMAVF